MLRMIFSFIYFTRMIPNLLQKVFFPLKYYSCIFNDIFFTNKTNINIEENSKKLHTIITFNTNNTFTLQKYDS